MVSNIGPGEDLARAALLRAPRTKTSIDVATIAGLPGAFLLVLTAIILGGSPKAFLDLKSILIVVGGTLGIVTACFSLDEIKGSFKVVLQAFFHASRDTEATAKHLLHIAETAKKEGVLALQKHLPHLKNSGILYKGVGMVIDGSSGDDVETMMKQEFQTLAHRNDSTIRILQKAAEISPAMGLIGTLVGLVQMLGNLEDPSTMGPSMAIALLTTFYGVILAHMVFTPLASKLERNSSEDMLIASLYVMSAASIGRKENPRRLEMLLNTVLPPEHRIKYFD